MECLVSFAFSVFFSLIHLNNSTLGLGGWFGALINGYFCDLFSRRWTLTIGAIICLAGTAVTTGAQNPSYMVRITQRRRIMRLIISSKFVGRFLIGWGVGGLSAAVPLFVELVLSL